MTVDPAFQRKDNPNLTIDLLRQGWQGAKSRVPDFMQRGMQAIEDWGQESGATAAGKGLAEAVGPAEPWELGAMALGPAAKIGGKVAAKAVGGATALAAGTEDAEAAQGMRRVFYDLLRKNAGDVDKAKLELQGMAAGMNKTDRAQATKVLKANIPPALVQREMLTNPGSNVYEVLANLRRETTMLPHEAFKVGDVLAPVAGDTTKAGVNVTRAGIPLKRKVELQGGGDYGLTKAPEEGVAWASEPTAALGKQANFNKAEGLVSGTGEVKGVHVAMAPEGAHFAKHTGDLWRQMLESGPTIDPAHMAGFNANVRQVIGKLPGGKNPESNKARALREWRGVQDPGMDALMNVNPEVRKALLATASKPGWQHLGFPDMDEMYKAALDPGLKTGDVGGAVMQAVPGADIIPGTHNTYSMDIRGNRTGRLAVPLPPEMVFGDVMSQFAPNKRAQALGSLRSAHHMRPVDQQFIDEASAFTEARLKALKEGSY